MRADLLDGMIERAYNVTMDLPHKLCYVVNNKLGERFPSQASHKDVARVVT